MKQLAWKIRMTALVFAVLAMTGLISLRVCAESGDSFLLDESGNVTLVSEHAEKEGIASLQFSIKVNAPEGAKVEFEFAEGKAIVCEARYDENTKILNIYMAGKTALFEKGVETLAIGRVKITDSSEGLVAVNIVENSLKYVYGSDVRMMEGVSLPEEILLQKEVLAGPPTEEPPKPTDPQDSTEEPSDSREEPTAVPTRTPVPSTESSSSASVRPGGTNGVQERPSSEPVTTMPPTGGSTGGDTVDGNENYDSSTQEPANTSYPQETVEPGRDEQVLVINDIDEQDKENGKKTNYIFPVVLGIIGALFVLGACLIAIAFKKKGNPQGNSPDDF